MLEEMSTTSADFGRPEPSLRGKRRESAARNPFIKYRANNHADKYLDSAGKRGR
jgi:hypothetical protein